jgi:3,4-dihydroxy-9,10-secoandrosta-1,3,5(10)-triene-9,17-dione 4,5-dioxygenase
MNVRGLGYIGLGAPNPAECLQYGTEILGAMPSRALAGEDWGTPAIAGQGPASKGRGIAPDGSVYLKLDDWQWRIAVHPETAGPGLLYAGFEVGGPGELQTALEELQAAGCAAQRGTEQQARSRSVTGIGYSRDPAGHCIEIFYGPTLDRDFHSPLGVQFMTGELGLGHLNFFVEKLAECQHFYNDVLGFKLTDYIRFGAGMSANFYHCNARHHSVGLMHMGPVTGLQHLMLEVGDIDQVGKCLDRALAAGITITSTLGRHVNDGVLSFYMRSPMGFEVEVGCGGVRTHPGWTPSEFVRGDVWGHKGLDPETFKKTVEQMTRNARRA